MKDKVISIALICGLALVIAAISYVAHRTGDPQLGGVVTGLGSVFALAVLWLRNPPSAGGAAVVLLVLLALHANACTPAERQAVLYADEAICAAPAALKGGAAETIAQVCDIELPIARAVVAAAGDAGAKP